MDLRAFGRVVWVRPSGDNRAVEVDEVVVADCRVLGSIYAGICISSSGKVTLMNPWEASLVMVVGVMALGKAANIFAVDFVGPGIVVQCGLSHVKWYTVGWRVDMMTVIG